MAPRGSSIGASSPLRAASHPAVARRLDFDQDESSLQETPALSGSGQRRGHRGSVYDIPEDGSPAPQTSAVLEESFVQEDITANEDSVVFNGVAEESSIAQIGYDTTNGAEGFEDLVELEQSDMTPEPVKEPAKRGRKRKSDVMEQTEEQGSSVAKARKRGAATAQGPESQEKGKEALQVPTASSRRSKRVSDMTEQTDQTDQDISALDGAADAPVPAKRRGRPARAKPESKEKPVPSKLTKSAASKAEARETSASAKTAKGATAQSKVDETFKKPPKPAAKSKDKPKSKERAKPSEQAPQADDAESGKLVDVHGHPLNKKDIEQMSTASVGSRYGRGRHLSVFRELEPEAVARVGRTGRHRVAPIDFWRNDRISYDPTGSMTSIVKNQDVEPERKSYKASSGKGKKRSLTAIEEEEIELDPWEEEEGILFGNYRDFDPVTDVTTNDIVEDSKLQYS